MVLDCCHAGAMGVKGIGSLPGGYSVAAIPPSLLMGGAKSVATPGAKGLETLSLGSGRAVLSSSTGEQQSYMRSDGKMSVFTYHLVEALTGHAEPEEGATEVLVSDVMGHVWRHVRKSAEALGVQQTPDYQVSGNFPIALLLGGKGLAKGQPAPDPVRSAQEEARDRVTRIERVDGPVAFDGGEAVDMRGSQGAVYKPSGSVTQHFGDVVHGGQVDGEAIAKAFAELYKALEQVSDGPKKAIATQAVEGLKKEAEKGEQADEGAVSEWFESLALMLPGIGEVAVNAFLNPVYGLATVFRLIAQRAKEEKEARAGS
jgi:hypothetical protein